MKKIIVGLGNPEEKYLLTRHNIGYMVLDTIMYYKNSYFYDAEIGKICILDDILYLKPYTGMNDSGIAVSYYMDIYNLQPKDVLVILDDLSMDFGKIRLRMNGSSGGHNGLKSIESCLESQEYSRLKIGIGNNYEKGFQTEYCLSNFTVDEQSELPNIIEKACGLI
jgi:PTH1 family peptidyl-tRNA hydrolase